MLVMFYMTSRFSDNTMASICQVSPNNFEHLLDKTSGCCRYSSFKLPYVTDRGHKDVIVNKLRQKEVCRSRFRRHRGSFPWTVSPDPEHWKQMVQKRTVFTYCARRGPMLSKERILCKYFSFWSETIVQKVEVIVSPYRFLKNVT